MDFFSFLLQSGFLSNISRRWTLTAHVTLWASSLRLWEGSAWCSGVWWANLLLIPPLFSTRSAARPRLMPYKARACQICDIIVICVQRRGDAPCAIAAAASSSERALFSVTQMIAEMAKRDRRWLLCKIQRGGWPLRPRTLQPSAKNRKWERRDSAAVS